MAAPPPILDIGRVLDDGPFASLQKLVILLAAMAIVLDGFDGQLIGFAIPLIIQEWGISKAALAPAVAAGLVGMAVGMALAGWVADRIGRRVVLASSVLLFGLATIAIGFAPGIATIIALRFVAGLGIGGALPCCSTLTAEYAPARSRTLAITTTIVCFPLGGMIAGLFAGWVLPAYGWRALFWIGGSVPTVYALMLFALLPESPRFLAHQRERWPELAEAAAPHATRNAGRNRVRRCERVGGHPPTQEGLQGTVRSALSARHHWPVPLLLHDRAVAV